MKTSASLRFSPALLAALFGLTLGLPTLRAQTAPAGSIRGQVSNAVTGKNLDGARVELTGREQPFYSSRDGTFEIPSLAPGVYTLAVEYPGLDRQEVVATVEAGQAAFREIKLTSNVYVLPEYTVAGDREGGAAAIVEQKKLINLQNVVTSDAFGNIAKGNVGNFLRRIPGIAGTTSEVDTENILVRGIAANFTSLDIDGTRSANGAPDDRAQSAAAIPTDMIERAEVIKTARPETEADSLGGRVNLVTKSAFDRKVRSISLRAASSYSLTYGKDVGRRDGDPFTPSVAGTYSDVYSVFGGRNNLGIIAQANYERILDVRSTTQFTWGNAASNGSSIPAGQLDYPQFNNVSVALHELERSAASVRADYKFSDQLSVGGSIGWGTFGNNMWRSRNRMAAGAVSVPLSTDPAFTVIDGARYQALRETRDQTNDRNFARFNGKWRDSGGLRVDFDLSYENAERREYRESISPTSARRFNYVLDRRPGSADPRWPSIRVIRAPYTGNTVTSTAAPTTFLDLNPFADNFSNANDATVFFRQYNSENEIFGSRINVTKDLKGRWPVQLKAGLRYRSDITKGDRDELNGALNVTTSTFLRDLTGFLDEKWNLRGGPNRYPLGYVPSEKKLSTIGAAFKGGADPLTAWSYNPAVFTVNTGNTRGNSLLNDRNIWEDISAAFVQGQVQFDKVQLLGGVRVEQTEIERRIPLRNRQVGVAGTLGEYTGRSRDSKSYQNAFPSLHGRYEFSRKLILHAAYSTTIGRPNFGDLLAAADANPDSRTINVPNLDLKPQESQNYDVSLEYYFEPIGVVSVGAFKKDITNFPVSSSFVISAQQAADEYGAPLSSGDTGTWTVTSKVNGGTAYVRGMEFNYSQQFSFLPGRWRGFGVFATYTLLQTRGTYSRGSGGVVTTDLENFLPRVANAGLSYNYGRYDLRAQWNYTAMYPEAVDINNPSLRNKWVGGRWQIDFSGRYKITKRFTLFCDLANLTSNNGSKYRGTVEPVRREETNALGFLLTAGVLANF